MDDLMKELESIGIDVSSALARFGGMQDLFLKYLFQLPEEPSVPEYRSFLEQGDNEEAERSIHSFKGVAGNLGIDHLYDIASKLVTMFRKNELSELSEINAELFAEFDRVVAEIKRLRAQ